MKPTELDHDEELTRLLGSIRRVSPLDAQAVADERARFLQQGANLQAAVSQNQVLRHNMWINQIKQAFSRKEHKPMLNTLLAVIVSITLFFGGAGATAYAAQTSQPDELLYPVKIFSEDTRVYFTAAPEEKINLMLELTNRRMAEMTALNGQGKPIPQQTTSRLQNELDTALQITAGLDNTQMLAALEQIRLQAQKQSQQMLMLMSKETNQTNPDLIRLQTRLQDQARLASDGETDPQSFKLQVQDRTRQSNPSQTPAGTQPHTPGVTPSPAGTQQHTPDVTPPPAGNSYGPGSGGSPATQTPGQYGPGPSQTPMPTGGSFGPALEPANKLQHLAEMVLAVLRLQTPAPQSRMEPEMVRVPNPARHPSQADLVRAPDSKHHPPAMNNPPQRPGRAAQDQESDSPRFLPGRVGNPESVRKIRFSI